MSMIKRIILISCKNNYNLNKVVFSVPCRNPKKESKSGRNCLCNHFLYVANMVATIINNCDQEL